ncbi:MAG: hypothetical protein KC549_00490, partial [Myxococcales bacterium]|nr:hypothetical protein [Myxococcales bacterium]
GGAGGGGGEQTCEAYCLQMESNCPDIYADNEACMQACAQFPTDGNAGDTDGNSLQCRIYHSGAPAMMDAALHCPHAAA